MKINALLARTGDQIGIHRVFGEPIERGEVTVVPVAVVMGGGGGGFGPLDPESGGSAPDTDAADPDLGTGTGAGSGAGAGFGVWARAIGAYEIRDGRVRFVPAIDVVALGVLGLLLTRIVGSAVRRAGRRRH